MHGLLLFRDINIGYYERETLKLIYILEVFL